MTTQAATELRISISQDGFEAYVFPSPQLDAGPVTVEELKDIVKQHGIVVGLDEHALERAAMTGPPDEKGIVIATGTRPVDGKDGWVEFLYETKEKESAQKDQGTTDVPDLHRIHNALSGQRLAVLHPPEAGSEGMKVTGEIVPAKAGRKPPLHCGSNTSFAEKDPSCIVATVDGNVVVHADGTIEVQPVVTIHGNADFSQGSLDFVGSMIITGDVFSGLSIKVRKNLEIHGNIEDAQIDAGGDVVIKKGFVGHGKGKLTAAGNVRIAHLVNQTIISQKDVIIDKESVAATVIAEGKIIGERASIVGGVLDAGQEVRVLNLGSSENSQVRAQAGRRRKMMARLVQVEQEIKLMEKQVTEVKDAVFRLIRMKIDKGSLPAEKEELLVKLQSVQKELTPRLERSYAEKTKLSDELKRKADPKIVVLDTAFENAVVEINGARKVIEVTMKEVVFVEHGGAIEEHPV